jgi:hypothetical protein
MSNLDALHMLAWAMQNGKYATDDAVLRAGNTIEWAAVEIDRLAVLVEWLRMTDAEYGAIERARRCAVELVRHKSTMRQVRELNDDIATIDSVLDRHVRESSV